MKPLSKDAREFVDNVAGYIQKSARSKNVYPKVHKFLSKVTTAAKRDQIAHVSTVVELTAQEKKTVIAMLESRLNRVVECRFNVDSSLIGGMRIYVADWIIDTSLEKQLIDLTHQLL